MSIKKYYRQINPLVESNVSLVEKIQDLYEETLPTDFFDGFTHEINTKASSSVRTVYTVRSKDRETDRDEILRRMRQAGIDANLGSSNSSVDPIDGVMDNKKFRINVKPMAVSLT